MIKKILKLAGCLAVALSTTMFAEAADWPTRPVKIITNLPVGTLPDVIYRKTADALSEKWKQPVVVDNRPGGGGMIALNEFEREAANNDHVILATDTGVAVIWPVINNREDVIKNIRPVAQASVTPFLVVASTKYSSDEEVLKAFRARPMFGSWSVGSIAHICGLELASALSSNLAEHVPYKEYGVWYSDLYNQNFALSCSSYGSARSMIDSNKLRVLAVVDKKRDPKMPQVPTIRELTGQDINSVPALILYFVSTNLDKSIANKIENDLVEVSQSAEVKTVVERGGSNSSVLGSKEVVKVLADVKNNLKQTVKKHQLNVNQ